MIVVFLTAFLFGITGSPQNSALGNPRQDQDSEVANVLAQLKPALDRRKVWFDVPWNERIERVRTRLVQLAQESPESRKTVIDSLITVLNDPKGQFDLSGVDRWRLSAILLGELNATEAIDALISKISWTSYDLSPHPRPPVRTALVRIGKPAVPRLLLALSDQNWSVRWESSEALKEIGEPSVEGLLGVLAHAEPLGRAAAAHALSGIGGARVREAIELALRNETDEETRTHLENALGFIDHVECLKDSSKCK